MPLRETQVVESSLETVQCNLCGSARHRRVYRMPDTLVSKDEWFSVVQCENCGLGFVNPRPPYEAMHRFYPPSYYDTFEIGRNRLLARYEAQARLVERFSTGKPGLLLDVGCANGDFPRFMSRRGWSVEGVEVSSAARAIHDFTVYRVEFPKAPVDRPRYQAITAWAVLEHVHDPMSYFEKAGRVLKDGGIFVFLVTNFDSISSSRLFREDVPRHLHFFTERTVRRYLSRAGLQLVHTDCSDKYFSMEANNWLRYLLSRRRGRPFTYEDAQFCRARALSQSGEAVTWRSTLRFLCQHPEIAPDRMLRRVFEKYQMWRGKYGILTFVARKSG